MNTVYLVLDNGNVHVYLTLEAAEEHCEAEDLDPSECLLERDPKEGYDGDMGGYPEEY